jgi:hypothetical protein
MGLAALLDTIEKQASAVNDERAEAQHFYKVGRDLAERTFGLEKTAGDTWEGIKTIPRQVGHGLVGAVGGGTIGALAGAVGGRLGGVGARFGAAAGGLLGAEAGGAVGMLHGTGASVRKAREAAAAAQKHAFDLSPLAKKVGLGAAALGIGAAGAAGGHALGHASGEAEGQAEGVEAGRMQAQHEIQEAMQERQRAILRQRLLEMIRSGQMQQ